MARKLLSLLSGAALIALFAESLVIGVLYAKGRLNADTVHEIREILRDPSTVAAASKSDVKAEVPVVTVDDVVRARSLRILQIEQRERELQALKGLVSDSRASVLSDREAATKLVQDFEAQKKAAQETAQTAAIEQARNVLLKAETALIVEQLTKLPLDESISLVKGMPEKKIAELLQAFSAGDPKSSKRGQEIFQAIVQGDAPRTTAEPTETAKN